MKAQSPAAVILTMLCTGVLATSAPAAGPPALVELTRDVAYGKGGDEDLRLNIARPNGDGKNRPCIVFIHGGGWAAGNRGMHDEPVREMARRGYVAATVSYRLAPEHEFPSQVHDVKCAVRYLRAHAEQYGLDPDRIAACGFSAGAHLAMMLGVTQKSDGLEGDGGWSEQSSAVQAVIAYFGPTDLTAVDLPEQVKPVMEQFLGGTLQAKPDEYKKASPVIYVDSRDAPMLIFQGTKDPLVPYTQAYRMLDALSKAGVPGRGEILLGAGHGWKQPEEWRRTAEAAFQFLDQHLGRTPATRPAAR